ncbi:MAG: DNA recombination protein RmuC [Kiritimatiellia bacterium]|jgi:DNA recombination protein RmuC
MLELWMPWIVPGLIGLLVLLAAALLLRSFSADGRIWLRLVRLEQDLERDRAWLRDELGRIRLESARMAKDDRDELARALGDFGAAQGQRLDAMLQKQEDLTTRTETRLEAMREGVDRRLQAIQADNSSKLEKMRETVDEKLHHTLETRLGESFKLVSERLERVQQGLGEMQVLATGVGDLKKVLSNVKTKGVLGECQLAALLEQMLAPGQYGENVKTKRGGDDRVEFAVRLPDKNDDEGFLWLPIDAKFPTQSYEALLDAGETGDVVAVERARKALEQSIRAFARDIRAKYVDPPYTTDFAILFLPFEGLYAEVLRITGLFESIQREFRVTITGPTTLSAFLGSLQMGFRSLAVERRTSEIWELLGTVREEFSRFGDVLERTKSRLDLASKDIESAGVRSRAIERHLRAVEDVSAESAVARGQSTLEFATKRQTD